MHYVKYRDHEGELRILQFLPAEMEELLVRLSAFRDTGVEFTHEFIDF